MKVTFNTWTDADFQKAFQYVVRGTTTPISLVGNILTLRVRKSAGDKTIAIQIDNSDTGGIVLTDAANGKFQVTLPKAKLSQMPEGVYAMSLVRKLPSSGPTVPIWHGPVNHKIGAG